MANGQAFINTMDYVTILSPGKVSNRYIFYISINYLSLIKE